MWTEEELKERNYYKNDTILLKKSKYEQFINRGKSIVINANGGNISISIMLLDSFMTNNEFFKCLDNCQEGIITIALFDGSSINTSVTYSQVQLILGINQLVKKNLLKMDTELNSKLTILNGKIDFSHFLHDFNSQTYAYEVDGHLLTLTVGELFEPILHFDNYTAFLRQRISDKYKQEFVFLLKEYIEEKMIFYTYFLVDEVMNLYQKLIFNYDTEAINKLMFTSFPKFSKIKINEQLKIEVFKQFDKHEGLEKIIYLYSYLFTCLKCDHEFAEMVTNVDYHLDIDRIETIDFNNNMVNSFEFAAIFGYFLNELGIHFDYNGDSYFVFRYDKYIIVAKLMSADFNGEIKNKREILDGLIIKNHNLKSKEEFEIAKNNIYLSSSSKDHIDNIVNLDFTESLDNYRKITGKNRLDIQKKMSLFMEIIKNNQIGENAIGYLFQLKNIFFDKNELDCYVSFTIINEVDISEEPIVIITYNPININLYNSNQYIYFNPPKALLTYDLNEIRKKFFHGKFKYVPNSLDNLVGIERNEL